jgi:hypothetical protein
MLKFRGAANSLDVHTNYAVIDNEDWFLGRKKIEGFQNHNLACTDGPGMI